MKLMARRNYVRAPTVAKGFHYCVLLLYCTVTDYRQLTKLSLLFCIYKVFNKAIYCDIV